MQRAIFIFESSRPFDYGAFTKHLIHSGNVLWSKKPGVMCYRPRFEKAVEVELGVDSKTAKSIVQTMIDLGMISVFDGQVTVNKILRQAT